MPQINQVAIKQTPFTVVVHVTGGQWREVLNCGTKHVVINLHRAKWTNSHDWQRDLMN